MSGILSSLTELLARHRSRLTLAAWIAYALGTWFLLVALPVTVPGPLLDASWGAVLNYAASINGQFGNSFVNTYGPLGYLHSGGYLTGT
ncbi:MAG TPA: hypothetical protein VF551_06735, partial [Chthoniobacterales bacterium]